MFWLKQNTIFPTLPVGNTLAACHVRLATTTRQFRSHPRLHFNSRIVGALLGTCFQTLFCPFTLCCVVITFSRSFWICFWILLDLIAMDSNKDVPSSVPSSPSTPSTSAAADVSACRTCPRCTRRMSSLKLDKHSLCVACRDVRCSVEIRCAECRSWSKDFMLVYVKHQRSLVSKARKEVTTSSPSLPVTAVTTAPVVSLPSLPPTPSFPSFWDPSSSPPPRSSVSSLPPPPGFPSIASSSSAPLSSSFLPTPPHPSVSLSLPSLASTPSGVSVSAPLVSSSFSSASSSSSFLDFTAYQASVLGLSAEYQTLARWYFKSGGSDFLSYLSAFYPHLSADASRDFSSGSSLSFCSLLDCLLSSASLCLSSSSGVCPSGVLCCSCLSSASGSSSSPSAFSFFFWFFLRLLLLLSLLCWGGVRPRCVLRLGFLLLLLVSLLLRLFPLSLCLLLLYLLSLRLLLSSLHLLLLSLLGVLWVCVLRLRRLVLLRRFLWTLRWLRILHILSFAPFLCLSLRPSL